MKLQKKKVVSLFVALMMLVGLVHSTDISMITAQAATKAQLSNTEITIGIGNYGSNAFYFHKTNDRYIITVDNPVKSASYTFTSSNKKIVTVKTSGTKAYLTGVKAGTATITCKQTLNGKTTTLGECQTTVEKASIREAAEANRLSLGTRSLGSWVQEPICYIINRIPDAKYTYSTNSKNLTIKDTKYDETQAGDGCFGYKQTYTAKKAGIYTVTVNETYQKKTREVGTFKVIIHDLKIEENIAIAPKDAIAFTSILSYRKSGMNYYFEGDGFDASVKKGIAYIAEDEYGDPAIFGVKEGTAKFKIYEGIDEKSKEYVGSCTVRVAADYVSFNASNISTFVGDESFDVYVCTAPETELEEMTVTSSDESILKVESGSGYMFGLKWKINPLKAGTTTLTAKKGNEITTCTVTVYATEDEYAETYWNYN
jgi:hypothetical protein